MPTYPFFICDCFDLLKSFADPNAIRRQIAPCSGNENKLLRIFHYNNALISRRPSICQLGFLSISNGYALLWAPWSRHGLPYSRIKSQRCDGVFNILASKHHHWRCIVSWARCVSISHDCSGAFAQIRAPLTNIIARSRRFSASVTSSLSYREKCRCHHQAQASIQIYININYGL